MVFITYVGIANFVSLTYFEKKSIKSLPTTCKEKTLSTTYYPEAGITSEPALSGADISSIAIHQLIVVGQAAKYYTLIGRTINSTNIHYSNILSSFNIECDTYEELKKSDDTDVLIIRDNYNYHQVIQLVSIITDCLSWTYGSRVLLVYVLRESSAFQSQVDDSL